MKRHLILLWALCLFLSASASAAPMMYGVVVNTSSLAGTTGSLDFNFNPGPSTTQSASVQILGFTPGGTLTGSPSLTGGVSGGPLPTTLTLTNSGALNDYFQGFTFGNTLRFTLSFYGPALSSPNGTTTSGSTFAFSVFSDAAGSVPALTSDTTDGFAFLVNVGLDGTTNVFNYSTPTAITAGALVPEPSTFAGILVAAGFGTALWLRRREG